jgi:addiction module HigA family antidote
MPAPPTLKSWTIIEDGMARVRTHPGEVLREEFMAPLGLSAHKLAEAIDVPPNRISEIAREARSMSADTALRLARHFDTTPEFWMNLQTAHDLSKAVIELAPGPVSVGWRQSKTESAGRRVAAKESASGRFLIQSGKNRTGKSAAKAARSKNKK